MSLGDVMIGEDYVVTFQDEDLEDLVEAVGA